jgi:sigma-B regulation protein RsbU (phosphoserine phosphatase)
MCRINQFLYERTEGEKYATVFYCVLDSDGKLVWSNAGHVTPFLVRRSGDLTTLDTTGMPLGMLDSAIVGVETTQLQPGDKIVAYSDGLTEAQDLKGNFFETKELRALLRAQAGRSASDLHSALMSRIRQFTGSAVQSDDITTLVLEYDRAQ